MSSLLSYQLLLRRNIHWILCVHSTGAHRRRPAPTMRCWLSTRVTAFLAVRSVAQMAAALRMAFARAPTTIKPRSKRKSWCAPPSVYQAAIVLEASVQRPICVSVVRRAIILMWWRAVAAYTIAWVIVVSGECVLYLWIRNIYPILFNIIHFTFRRCLYGNCNTNGECTCAQGYISQDTLFGQLCAPVCIQ